MSTRGKKNERGMSAVDYGLIVAGIAALLVVVLPSTGVGLGAFFEKCAVPGIEKGYTDPSKGEGCPGD